MSMLDLIGERRSVVASDGRRFVLRPPTVATFHLAVSVLGAEIKALFDANGPALIAGVAAFATAAPSGRLGRVLATCMEPSIDVPDAITHDPGLAARALVALAGMFDAKRTAQWLRPIESVDAAESADGMDDEVDDNVLLVLRTSERLGIDPREVMEWPIGLFMDVVDVYARGTEAAGKRNLTDQVFSPAFGGTFGSHRASPVVGGPERFIPVPKGA